MARFYGHLGFANLVETAPGVHREVFTERPYIGDLKQDLRKLQPTETLNDSIILQNLVEIMSDKYAQNNYFAIRYVRFNEVCWKVGYVEVRYPRLWIRFGEVYNGEIASGPPQPPDDNSGE